MAFNSLKSIQQFNLCDTGNLIFHWADFHETCEEMKTQMHRDQELWNDFGLRKDALQKLTHIPVWIKTINKVHHFSVFELYENYILNNFKDLGLDAHCPLEISFIAQTGPFKTMSISECFNHQTYRDFILMYLIEGKVPRRDYRIRLKSRILMEYGKDFSEAQVVSLEQMSMNGLLLSMNSDEFLKKVSHQDEIRLLINSKILTQSMDKSLTELKQYLADYSFNFLYSSDKEHAINCQTSDFVVQSAFDFAKNKKVYLFISHENLSKTHPEAVSKMKEFVNFTRRLVRNNYSQKFMDVAV